eukprot:GFUD01022255.1.p1 GENE.GFUD01022255.1~~GFUD01022255.1.p1  ORF type:complete len:248 (-),score=84.37 GFUD01022255.1:75-818(-)
MGSRDMKDYKLGQAICDQIRVAGSVKIYNRLKDSFTGPPDIYFIKEQFALYKWRKEFFLAHFPGVPLCPTLGPALLPSLEDTWTTDCNFCCDLLGISSDIHWMAAIHYNITENFDQVLKLAFEDSRPDLLDFPTDYSASCLFNKFEWDKEKEQEVLQKLTTVDLSTAVHIICVLYNCSPPSLLQVAMRRVLELGLSLDSLPKELQVVAERGLYYIAGREAVDGLDQKERPRCLTSEGEKILNMFLSQ